MNDMGSMTGDPALTLLGTRSPQYVLRVPNERDVPTVRVELHFPAGLRVVSFGDVPDGIYMCRRIPRSESRAPFGRASFRRSTSSSSHSSE